MRRNGPSPLDLIWREERDVLEQHQEVLLSCLAQKSRALAEAQERIRGGGYGICAACGRRIPPRRLKALPTATLCVACQERRETAYVAA